MLPVHELHNVLNARNIVTADFTQKLGVYESFFLQIEFSDGKKHFYLFIVCKYIVYLSLKFTLD